MSDKYKAIYDAVQSYVNDVDIYQVTINTKDKTTVASNKTDQFYSLVNKITSLIEKEFISKDPSVVRIATEELPEGSFYRNKPIYIDAKGFKAFLDTTARIYNDDVGYDTELFFKNWEDYYLNYLYGGGIYKNRG